MWVAVSHSVAAREQVHRVLSRMCPSHRLSPSLVSSYKYLQWRTGDVDHDRARLRPASIPPSTGSSVAGARKSKSSVLIDGVSKHHYSPPYARGPSTTFPASPEAVVLRRPQSFRWAGTDRYSPSVSWMRRGRRRRERRLRTRDAL